MYKKQMKLQKIFCLIAMISGALLFVYSLGIMTDLHDALVQTIRRPDDPERKTSVAGSFLYYDMQGFNRTFLYCALALILLACLLYITNTHIRRRYYIGNYISGALYAAAAAGIAVWSHLQIESYKAQFLQIDFAALKEFSDARGTLYTESTFWFDIHYLLMFILLAAAALVIFNLVWKSRLMKEEAQLLSEGAGKEMA